MSTYPATTFPEVVRHDRLYVVTEPYERNDRDGWWVSYVDPLTEKRRKKKFPRQADAWAFSGQVEKDRDGLRCGRLTDRDVLVGAKAMTKADKCLNEFALHQKRKNISKKYIKENRRILDKVHADKGWGCPQNMTLSGLDNWLDGYGGSTANTYLTRVLAYANWLVSDGYLHSSPFEHAKSRRVMEDTRLARALTYEELDDLLTCPEIPEHRRLWYAVSARAGMRHNEIGRLVWGDIDFKEGWLILPANKTKTDTAAEVPMPTSLVEWLKEHRKGDDTLIFKSMHYRGGKPNNKTWDGDIEKAGIEKKNSAGYAYMKSLRKTYITHLLDVSDGNLIGTALAARHSNPNTTKQHYVDPRLLDMKGMVEKLDDKKPEKVKKLA